MIGLTLFVGVVIANYMENKVSVNLLIKNVQFKAVCNGDMAYITQLKQQKSKRCYYFGSTSP